MTTLADRPGLTPSTGKRPDSDALIKEARQLRRRRYLIVGVVLLVVAGGSTVGFALSQGGGRRITGSGHSHTVPAEPKAIPPTSATRYPEAVLPSSALITQISVTPKGLLLTGETRASFGKRSPTTCVAAPIDPRTLALGKLEVGSCNDPLLSGLTVAAVSTLSPQSNNATISVDTANAATGRVHDGPPIMTFGSYSDTHPVVASGARWTWIYDVDTTAGPELLQVSADSGAVVDTVPMPALYRPLLAADGGGVWVANSIGGSPAAALSYVAAGASAPRVVVAATDQPICWLVASGTSAWVGAGVDRACAQEGVERFTDDSTVPVFTVAAGVTPPAATVIGDEANGLWTMQWVSPTREEIVHIDPDTGSEAVVGTLASARLPTYETDEGLTPGQSAYFDGSLYLLEPPFRKNGYLGYTSIVRVVPPHAS
jgi:hypothetical protein